jgi:hypothetical protein
MKWRVFDSEALVVPHGSGVVEALGAVAVGVDVEYGCPGVMLVAGELARSLRSSPGD